MFNTPIIILTGASQPYVVNELQTQANKLNNQAHFIQMINKKLNSGFPVAEGSAYDADVHTVRPILLHLHLWY